MQDWNPKKWVRILLPTVLVIVWLALAGLGGPTFGKISSVSTNDQAGFLPSSAQSTLVNEWQAKFRESKELPAVIVSESNSGAMLTPADLVAFAKLGQQLSTVHGVAAPKAPATTSVIGPIPSADKQAVEFIVPLTSSGEELRKTVEELREVVAKGTPSGYTSYVGGPAGLLADFVNGFGGIDSILLVVALLAVFVILLIVYRSLLLPILVLLTAVFALSGSILGIYYLALNGVIKVSGQSQGILSILVIGAATDYALLLVARFREGLLEVDSKWAAMGRALKGSFEPILASAGTVILALLCLLFSDLNSNKALGPIAAFGIGFAFLAAMTFLPALLVIFGRAAFWPFAPKPGQVKQVADQPGTLPGLEGIRGLWRSVGQLVGKRPRTTWIVSALLLVAAIAALPTLKANGVPQTELLLTQSQAVDGQKVLAEHFDAGSGSPAVIIANEANYQKVVDAIKATPGVSTADVQRKPTGAPVAIPGVPLAAPVVVDGKVLINATLKYQSDSAEAEEVVKQLRNDLAAIDAGTLVGGTTAIALDTNQTAQADILRIIPIVLFVIFIILMLLLRSIVAPLVLILTVVLSYGATMGVSAIVFNNILGFPGADATVPLFGFVFLVALGIDYNIFLMTRVREESLSIGTRPGILRGLAVTGGVITSAGVVLAATFAALGVIPLLFLVQLAFIVAFGVILDTVLVRSLLVPALSYDIGRAIWWPSKLAKGKP